MVTGAGKGLGRAYAGMDAGVPARMNLVTLLTVIWAARLGLHVGSRNRGRSS